MNRKTENPVALTTTRAEAPPWMRGDQYITTGYRRPLISIYRCVISLLYFHNEWVNVWSHLVPGVAHALLLLRECRQFFMEREGARYLVQMIVWQYIGSCVLCLLVSVNLLHLLWLMEDTDVLRQGSILSQLIRKRSQRAGSK